MSAPSRFCEVYVGWLYMLVLLTTPKDMEVWYCDTLMQVKVRYIRTCAIKALRFGSRCVLFSFESRYVPAPPPGHLEV